MLSPLQIDLFIAFRFLEQQCVLFYIHIETDKAIVGYVVSDVICDVS